MGKSPQEFVPVKYANAADQGSSQTMNWLIGAAFVMMLIQLYRSMHGKGGSGGQSGG
jgi:hypothetical protein